MTGAAQSEPSTELPSHRWSGIIAIEGEPTGNGRLIANGALTWPEHDLPLTYEIDGRRIGSVEEIWRDGDLIRAKGSIQDATLGHVHSVGVSLEEPQAEGDFEGGFSVVTKAAIREVAIVAAAAWADAQILLD
jgi:hypothetical protein